MIPDDVASPGRSRKETYDNADAVKFLTFLPRALGALKALRSVHIVEVVEIVQLNSLRIYSLSHRFIATLKSFYFPEGTLDLKENSKIFNGYRLFLFPAFGVDSQNPGDSMKSMIGQFEEILNRGNRNIRFFSCPVATLLIRKALNTVAEAFTFICGPRSRRSEVFDHFLHRIIELANVIRTNVINQGRVNVKGKNFTGQARILE